ncbi:hypothetical protein LB553_28730 [Mesorhizobium sp. CA8]|nr:hypothetical protein [Mesorhizobium sp. CA8]
MVFDPAAPDRNGSKRRRPLTHRSGTEAALFAVKRVIVIGPAQPGASTKRFGLFW